MGAIDSKILLYQSDGAIRIDGDTDFNSYNVRARVDDATIGIKVVDTDDIFASKAHVRIGGVTKALKRRGIPAIEARQSRKGANAYSPISSDEVWLQAYTAWQATDWSQWGSYYPASWQALYCLGYFHTQPTRWVAEIYTDKFDIIFRPVNYITEAEWDLKSSPLTLIMPRSAYTPPVYPEQEEGGAIKCVQTGEINEQIAGNLIFSIPKGITNYNEFSLTMEGLCRNIGDLKHSSPVWGEYSYKGMSVPSLGNTQII